MSRRGTCHDNAVAGSFLSLLKRERIRRRVYRSREEARQDEFDYIDMFDNPQRKHFRYGMQSPAGFERQQKNSSRRCSQDPGRFRWTNSMGVDHIILDPTSPTESGRMMWLAFILSSHYS